MRLISGCSDSGGYVGNFSIYRPTVSIINGWSNLKISQIKGRCPWLRRVLLQFLCRIFFKVKYIADILTIYEYLISCGMWLAESDAKNKDQLIARSYAIQFRETAQYNWSPILWIEYSDIPMPIFQKFVIFQFWEIFVNKKTTFWSW